MKIKPASTDSPKLVISALNDLKATDVVSFDVSQLTDVTDTLVIATATSNRQLRALAAHVIDAFNTQGVIPVGVEGLDSEWALLDFGDVVVHVMLSTAREFYDLENLWQLPVLSGNRAESCAHL